MAARRPAGVTKWGAAVVSDEEISDVVSDACG